MKRLLIFMLFATTLVACNNKSEHNIKSIYISDGDEVWIAGKSAIHAVECTVKWSGERPMLTAKSDVEWITITECGGSLVWYIAEDNHSGTQREGYITVSCGDKACELHVIQRPYADMEFEAMLLDGSTYYGTEGMDSQKYNYYVVLSDAGVSELGYLYDDSRYYFLDLYSTTPANNSSHWSIPHGEYDSQEGSVGLDNSYFAATDSDYEEIAVKAAKVEVGHRMIEAHVVLENDKSVNVWYRGSLMIYNDDAPHLSTLYDDYKFDIDGATFVGTMPKNNLCELYIFEKFDYETGIYSGDMFQLTLHLPAGSSEITGSYTVGEGEGSFIAGTAVNENDNITLCNSWYMTADYTTIAPLVGGRITIRQVDTGGYIFTIEAEDDAKNRITGSIAATGELVEL